MIQNKHILIGNLWYWLITNFACWEIWYPHTVDGFIQCYYLAIPFYFTATLKIWAIIRLTEAVYYSIMTRKVVHQ